MREYLIRQFKHDNIAHVRQLTSHLNHSRLLIFAHDQIMQLRQNVMDLCRPEDLTHEMNTEDPSSVWFAALFD